MNALRLALIALVAAQLASSAAADNFSWNFQRTGFRSSLPSSMPQTAVSMRANLSWPVVYGIDQGRVHAYSLFPVANPGPVPIGPATNWHQIGTDLTKNFLPSSVYLQAASGAPDGFGVAIQTPAPTIQPPDVVVVGNSLTGFQPPLNGMQALKFDHDGDPFIASTGLVPISSTSQKLFDVAISPSGEIAAITQSSFTEGPLTYWHQSPLLGGKWLSTTLNQDGRNDPRLFGATVDLTFDSSSRPHVLGINRISTNNLVSALSFNITTGAWAATTLDTGLSNNPPIADVAAAANDQGIVGAAWVSGGVLKYAYLDTNESTPNWVVTTVASATPTGLPLERAQGVGLAYDQSGLPVISFVDQGKREIWIAYDPPIALAPHPGPADFNGDGFVDGGDLQGWSIGFSDGPAADADGDGATDGSDFLAWQRSITGPPNPAATAAIPEPASLSIVLIAATVVLGTSRRQGS
jgi:hypothetical protein